MSTSSSESFVPLAVAQQQQFSSVHICLIIFFNILCSVSLICHSSFYFVFAASYCGSALQIARNFFATEGHLFNFYIPELSILQATKSFVEQENEILNSIQPFKAKVYTFYFIVAGLFLIFSTIFLHVNLRSRLKKLRKFFKYCFIPIFFVLLQR